jgi:hypothetical protein
MEKTRGRIGATEHHRPDGNMRRKPGRRGKPVTAIFRGATLVAWFDPNGDGTATFEGQDLGGYPTSAYEYWLKVDQQACDAP